MTKRSLALLMLAGSVTLAGCGGPSASPAAPSAPATGQAGPVSQAPSQAQPSQQTPGSTVDVTPTTGGGATPASGGGATPAAGGGSSGSGLSSSGGGGGSSSSPAGGTTAQPGPVVPAPGGGPVVPGPVPGAPGVGPYGNTDFIVFASDRYPSEGNNDIYVFDPLQDTVLAIVGVNTYNNEFNPRISDNGHWLVFQRTVGYKQDVLLYSMDAKLVNTLHGLNTEYDEYMPDITNDGCKIVYVSDADGYPEVRLYDVTTGDNWVVPGANRNFADITWPTISANGLKIAYGASIAPGYGYATDGTYNPTGGPAYTGGALYPAQSDIYIYDVAHGVQLTPPFINTAFDEYNPDLCLDGSRILFVSNRLGTEDIFEVNLDTGFTDNLAFLNSYELDEQMPRYLGGNIDRIAFQIKYPDSTYPVALRAYNRTSATLDTLPVANQLFSNSALRAPQPEVADVTP